MQVQLMCKTITNNFEAKPGCRLDNIDEQDGRENTDRLQRGTFARQELPDLGHQRFAVAHPGNVIIARKLDELCGLDLRGHVATSLAGHQSIATPVENTSESRSSSKFW